MDRRQYYKNLVDSALQSKSVIIYGAHLVAKELYECLVRTGRKFVFLGFAVTSLEDNPKTLENEKVVDIMELSEYKKEAYVLIAMPEKFHDEVKGYLQKLGFYEYGAVGLRGISCLLGEDIVEWNDGKEGRYQLAESKNDYTWLDLYERGWNDIPISTVRHYKFPIMTRFSRGESFACLERFDFHEGYHKVLGEYRNLHDLPVGGEWHEKAENILNMYMVMSHKDGELGREFDIPEWTHSIQAGTVLTNKHMGEFLDSQGDNISEKNVSYAEMTAMYWIWKNADSSPYKGLCHYRRHFDISSEEAVAMQKNDIDVVLTTPRLVLNSVREMFVQDTPVKADVFQNMMNSIREVWGDAVWEMAEEYFQENLYYPNNMFIAKDNIFRDYCEWIFPVLFKMEEHDRENNVVKTDRHIAFSAELLTSFYFVMKREHYKIAVTDYIFLGA